MMNSCTHFKSLVRELQTVESYTCLNCDIILIPKDVSSKSQCHHNQSLYRISDTENFKCDRCGDVLCLIDSKNATSIQKLTLKSRVDMKNIVEAALTDTLEKLSKNKK